MEIAVDHLGAVQFEIQVRRHRIISDQPLENGGFDEGVTPPELFAASLGSCAAYYAADYLRRKKLAEEGTRVCVSAEKVTNPPRLDNFVITVEVPLALTEEYKKGVEQSIRKCLIHNTLMHPPKIFTEVKELVEA